MNIYSAKEIWEIAIQIEKNGTEFYKRAEQLASTAETKKIVHNLAVMEEGHQSLFTALKTGESSDSTEEELTYLTAMAKAYSFFKDKTPERRLEEGMNETEILQIAIEFEMSSLAFFQGLRAMVSRADQHKLDALIQEEQKHVVTLSEKLIAYSS